jgi:hypothetical protein
MCTAIKALAKGKAAGLDGIPGEFLQAMGPYLGATLARVFNAAVKCGCLTKVMREGSISLI